MLALRKRPVAAEAIDAAVASIEEKLLTSGRREVDTVYVGELVMQELKRLDKIAYIRFASVYKNFEDLAEFQEAIAEVGQPASKSPPFLVPPARLSQRTAGLSSPDNFGLLNARP
jgi:transcriptional repressor NrdR